MDFFVCTYIHPSHLGSPSLLLEEIERRSNLFSHVFSAIKQVICFVYIVSKQKLTYIADDKQVVEDSDVVIFSVKPQVGIPSLAVCFKLPCFILFVLFHVAADLLFGSM